MGHVGESSGGPVITSKVIYQAAEFMGQVHRVQFSPLSHILFGRESLATSQISSTSSLVVIIYAGNKQQLHPFLAIKG